MAQRSLGVIRTGIGGWTFEPWRGVFFPEGLAHAKELHYASRALTTIEVNGTYYRTQTPATFAKWAADVPDGFVFTVKASRFSTNRRVLAEAGESIDRFLKSGLAELGDKLGPILWQFAPTKKFDATDFAAFLELLPKSQAGVALRHALEVRHDTFRTPEFIALARRHKCAIVFADHAKYPAIADLTSDFVYARLQTGEDSIKTAYPPKALDRFADCARTWAAGGAPESLPIIDSAHPAPKQPRDVFMFIIHDGKVRAPAGAQALADRLGIGPTVD